MTQKEDAWCWGCTSSPAWPSPAAPGAWPDTYPAQPPLSVNTGSSVKKLCHPLRGQAFLSLAPGDGMRGPTQALSSAGLVRLRCLGAGSTIRPLGRQEPQHHPRPSLPPPHIQPLPGPIHVTVSAGTLPTRVPGTLSSGLDDDTASGSSASTRAPQVHPSRQPQRSLKNPHLSMSTLPPASSTVPYYP